MPAKGKGKIQRGLQPNPTYYSVGAAKFRRSPDKDETGELYREFLAENNLSATDVIRLIATRVDVQDILIWAAALKECP